ncbi:MAG: ATP-grasp domain-containing protein [Bacteroidales bacterium]|nr:ATP-grasp domain-containing protein [Bacteroidales bacterium]
MAGKKPLNILFLGGGKRVSIGRMFLKAARDRGYEPRLMSYEIAKEVPISLIAEVIVGQRWSDPRCLPHLIDVIRERDIHLVVPFVDPAVEIAALLREELGVYSPVSDYQVCRRMFDKVDSAQLFESLDIPIPRTLTLSHPHFPKIAKPRRGSASKGIVVLRSTDDKLAMPEDEYVIQEYFENAKEFTVDAFKSRGGDFLGLGFRRRLETAGGEVVRSITVDGQRRFLAVKEIIDKLGLCGAITLQFIEPQDGIEWRLMEINPRLGGGAVLSVHAGWDIPAAIIDEYCKKNLTGHTIARAEVEMARYFQEVVFQH